ncbi:hypothetical protein LCGC14_0405570 [marine sediment metagenome]|uniref:Uncharacterized protein n=1 Tax=marine sediment metagenome TaxID=412755 RepID=A0A0F9W4M8_9ZZZZ|nr:hypothetical protein [archaeon]
MKRDEKTTQKIIIISVLVFTLFIFLTTAYLPEKRDYSPKIEIKTANIISLTDRTDKINRSLGPFILFVGSYIYKGTTEEYYLFYEEINHGYYKKKKLPVYSTIIKKGDDVYPHYETKTTWEGNEVFSWRSDIHTLFVPGGTIVRSVK